MKDGLYEVLVALLVGLLTSLLLPTFIMNGGNLYGICSARYIDNQRLFIPTKEAFGHVLQGFIAIGLLMFTDDIGLNIRGIILALIYPIYNLVKRNLPGQGQGLGLNNTSYANNIFDFLVGVWSGYLLSWIVKIFFKKMNRTCDACQYSIIAALMIVLLLNIIGAIQVKKPISIEECPEKCIPRWLHKKSVVN